MDFNALLKNKAVLGGIFVGFILILVLVFMLASGMNKSSGEESRVATPKEEKLKENVKLLSTTDTGKALEIQALLARQGIRVRQGGKGSKIELILSKEDGITVNQRDQAIVAIVKSGAMDKNIGLEIFDKGDFTSSREDKRIRLRRAVNGELSRLIKKMPGIEDASVFIAIPKDTIFTEMKKPTTATVQIVLPPIPADFDSNFPDKLDRSMIRAIKNLLLGSVEGMEAENISITDTNGNVYSSIMSATDDMMKLLEDKDIYMKKKIIAQLDKLIGKGNYVVTVSTYLRETPLETAKVIYNPQESTVGTKQKFTENLGDSSQDKNKLSGAVSSYLPGKMSNPESRSNRNYKREAEEYSYKVGQMRVSEVKTPGTLEEISIAVTLSKGTLPAGMLLEDLKQLIARTASPKASAENVQIAFSDKIKPYLSQERPVQLPKPEESGNPWWTIIAIVGGVIIVLMVLSSSKSKGPSKEQKQEIDSIKEIAQKQNQAIEEANQRTMQLQQMQQQMYEQIAAGQQQAISQQQAAPAPAPMATEVEEDIDEEELATTLKSWIESSG